MSASRGTGAAILRREVLALRRAVCAYEAGTTFDVDQETSEAIDRAFDWHNPDGRVGSADHHLPELEAALRTPTPDPPPPCPVCGDNEAKRLTTVTLRPCPECADEMDEPSPPVEEGERGESLRDRIEDALLRYRCAHTEHGELGEGLPLVDALTPPKESSIRLGRVEVGVLADYLEASLAAPDARQEERPWAVDCTCDPDGPPMMHESDCPYSFAHQGEGEPGDAELLLLAEQWCRGDVRGGCSVASRDDLEAAADAIRRLRSTPEAEESS